MVLLAMLAMTQRGRIKGITSMLIHVGTSKRIVFSSALI